MSRRAARLRIAQPPREIRPPTPEPESTVPRLHSVQALAARWTLRPDTIRAWARRGVLPSIKIGSKVLFEESALVDFLSTRRGAP